MTTAAPPARRYRYSTRDLLTIAVIAAVGGVVGALAVGPWAKFIEGLLGPFGAALNNFLHIFWPILAFLIVRKPGVILATSMLYGVVEVLAGSLDGSVVLVFMFLQGALSEVGMAVFRYRPWWLSIFVSGAGSGVGCAIGILYIFGFVTTLSPPVQILFVLTLAVANGVLGGLLASSIHRGLARVGATK